MSMEFTLNELQRQRVEDHLALVEQVLRRSIKTNETVDGMGLGVAPIGHVVTVDTAEEQPVNISTIIEFDVGYGWANTQAAIEENISAYLLELRQSWGKIENMNNPTVVRISQIETRLLTVKGIVDVTGTKINGTAANLSISGNKIPVIGAVTNGA